MMKIHLFGNITLYTGTGKYQHIVKEYYHSGKGILFKQFNNLKKKLVKEGLFEQRHKKKLPSFPEKIGVITSIDGSVIQDILDILNRRAPYIEIFIRISSNLKLYFLQCNAVSFTYEAISFVRAGRGSFGTVDV